MKPVGVRDRLRGDRGRVTIFFAILAPAFIAVLGLVIDGGGKVRALQRADNIAAEAARAAGQAIQAGPAISGGAKVVDTEAAAAAATSYLTATAATGTVHVDPDLQHLTVTVSIRYDPVVLGFVGATAWTVQGSATATLVVQ